MAFRPIKIDDSFLATEYGRPYLGEGVFLFEVTGITPSKEDYDGEPYWRWHCRIVDGPRAVGRSWTHITTFKEEAHFGLGRMFNALGLNGSKMHGLVIPTYQAFCQLAERVATAARGRRFGALVGDGAPRNGRPQSELLEIFSGDEYQARASRYAAPQPSVEATAETSDLVAEALKIFGD